MILNTTDLICNTTGKNKAFLIRVTEQQEQKYGNVDIFDCVIRNQDDIEIQFGDYYIRFWFRNDQVYDTIGTGQGHKYHKNLQSVAEEIRRKYINNKL